MKTFKFLLISFLLSSLMACSGGEKKEADTEEVDVYAEEGYTIPENMPSMIQEMARKHNIRDFYSHDVIAFDINLSFGGQERLVGKIYSRTNSTRVKVEKANGVILLYDGKEVYISPDTADYKNARFDALAWSYFALAPFKFVDEGSKWGALEKLSLRNQQDSLKSIKLTYEEGVGDTPDDWYQIYQNDSTGLLEAMGYIVTYGNTTQEEAEKNPHAIVYHEYEPVDGAILSYKWEFYTWDKSTGIGEKIGEATLNNIKFLEEDPNMFSLSTGFEMVPAGS